MKKKLTLNGEITLIVKDVKSLDIKREMFEVKSSTNEGNIIEQFPTDKYSVTIKGNAK